MMNKLFLKLAVLPLLFTSLTHSQDIKMIKFRSVEILDEYAKKVVCYPVNLKTSISTDGTYKIFIQKVESNSNTFDAIASLSVKCYSKKNGAAVKKYEEVPINQLRYFDKKIPMKIKGQVVNSNGNEQIIISEILLKTTSTYNKIFPPREF